MNKAECQWYDAKHAQGIMVVNGHRCSMGSDFSPRQRKDGGRNTWPTVRVWNSMNPSGKFYISAASTRTLEKKVRAWPNRLIW